jgi:hypothetical protein
MPQENNDAQLNVAQTSKNPSTQELVTAIKDLKDDDKDKLTQEIFMGKDFS